MELISRRGALQAIAKLKSDYDCDYNTIVEKCYDAVKKLPAHSDERKRGKWYGAENKCSCCNRPIWSYRKLPFDWQPRYCPHCGAKMEVGK